MVPSFSLYPLTGYIASQASCHIPPQEFAAISKSYINSREFGSGKLDSSGAARPIFRTIDALMYRRARGAVQ
jgi:hypothetical protein